MDERQHDPKAEEERVEDLDPSEEEQDEVRGGAVELSAEIGHKHGLNLNKARLSGFKQDLPTHKHR